MATIKKKLTKAELDFLAGAIEIWYLSWKDKLIDKNGNHQLMVAKEELKEKLRSYSYRQTKKRGERPPEKKAGFLRLLASRFEKNKNPVIIYKKSSRLKKFKETL